MNLLKVLTMVRAFSLACSSNPARITLSLLTVSIICSLLLLISSIVFLKPGLSKGAQAAFASSLEALLTCSCVGASVCENSLAFSSFLSASTASSKLLTNCFRDLPSAASLISFLSATSISLSMVASLPASEVRVSSSRLPRATDKISFSKGMLLLRSSGLESVLSFSHTPTASTITKRVL